jgi:ribonuclease BN (tRNA processing enzyme)
VQLTVLGSGTTVPHPERSSSGYWLQTAAGSILLDCAPSVPHRGAQEGFDWSDLDAIWISHFHLDHCGGLAPLLQGLRHHPKAKGRSKPLMIWGPPGLERLIRASMAVNNYKLLDHTFSVEIREVERLKPTEFLPGLTGTAMPTEHTDESHLLHLEEPEGKTLVYSGDMGLDESIVPLANAVDLLLLECTYLKNKPTAKHLELAEAMYLIRKTGPVRALLTHFDEQWDGVDFVSEVAAFSPRCEVLQASDGLRVEI